MARNKRFASTLEKRLIPYLRSIEGYLAATGLKPEDYSAYSDARGFFESMVPLIRSGGHLWATSADASLMKLNELQDVLPIILERMPAGFTLDWNAIAGELERDLQAMHES